MRTFAFLAALILYWASPCVAEDVNRDTVAEKFGYKDWKHFLEQMPTFWDWKKVDSSKVTSAEAAFVLKWADETYPPSPDTGRLAPMWFNLHLKFKDPKALELVEKQFARGWYWAAGAEDSVREAGELSLIPLAAKYLSVDKPSEPMPPMGDVIYPGEPFIYAANAILGLLKGSYQTSEAIKKACYDQRMMYNNVPLFRRWWAANEDRCRKGDFAHLSSPLDYLKDQRKKP